MKIWLFLGLGGTLSFAFLLISLVGINPKPIKLIKPSQFKDTQEIAYSLYKRLFPEINESSQVVLVYLEKPGFKNVWLELEQLVINQNRKINTRVLSLNDYIQSGESSRQPLLENKSQAKIVLFQEEFGRSSKEIESISVHCPDAIEENSNLILPTFRDLKSRLNCMAVAVSKKALKKQYSAHKWVATAEQLSYMQYVLFISPNRGPLIAEEL